MISNAVIKTHEGAAIAVIAIDQSSDSPMYVGCYFIGVAISIFDGKWYSTMFRNCLFKNCKFMIYKNADKVKDIDEVGGNVIK